MGLTLAGMGLPGGRKCLPAVGGPVGFSDSIATAQESAIKVTDAKDCPTIDTHCCTNSELGKQPACSMALEPGDGWPPSLVKDEIPS